VRPLLVGRKSHLPSVCRLHPLHITFRPRGFSPPRRLAPLGGSGMLQPDPDRVRCVSRRLPSLTRFVTRRSRSKRSSCTRRSSQRGSYPSKHSPRRQPYRITAAVALLPLSSPTRVVVLPKQSRPGGSRRRPTLTTPRWCRWHPEAGLDLLLRMIRRPSVMPPPCSASGTGDHDRALSEESARRRVSGVQIDARRVYPSQRPERCAPIADAFLRSRPLLPARRAVPEHVGVPPRGAIPARTTHRHRGIEMGSCTPEPCRSLARVLEGMGPRHRRSSAASAATRHEVSPAPNHRPSRTVARPYPVTCAVPRSPKRTPGALLHRGAGGTDPH
jgi:hypothetical protein